MRFGMIDIGAAGALLMALLLPSPSRPVKSLYAKEQASLSQSIAEAQADLARDQNDGAAAARLSELLVSARQTDWAVRAGAAGAGSRSPERWRAAVAVSAAHMDRKELGPAMEWADKAVASCGAPDADCPDYERARLEVYAVALRSVADSGVDMKRDGRGVVNAAERAVPLIRLGKPR